MHINPFQTKTKVKRGVSTQKDCTEFTENEVKQIWERSSKKAEGVIISQTPKSPNESATTVVRIMMPMDANVRGNVFGGSILKFIDEVASIVAFKHSRSNVVTASIDRMDFISPVYIGDLLRMIASINYVHRTSMEIGVRVEAENPISGQVRHTGTCFLTHVALDKNGKPIPVPPLKLETEEERRRWSEAEVRRRRRLDLIKKA
jgi:acyl-CoA hydrolase